MPYDTMGWGCPSEVAARSEGGGTGMLFATGMLFYTYACHLAQLDSTFELINAARASAAVVFSNER